MLYREICKHLFWIPVFAVFCACIDSKNKNEQKSIIDSYTFPGDITSVKITAADSTSLLLGMEDSMFISLSPAKGESRSFPLPKEPTNMKTYCVYGLDESSYLICKRNSGVLYVKYNKERNIEKKVTIKHPHQSKGNQYSAYDIKKTIAGDYLIASSNGLMYLTKDDIESIHATQDSVYHARFVDTLDSLSIEDLVFHKNLIYAATNKGIYIISGDSATKMKTDSMKGSTKNHYWAASVINDTVVCTFSTSLSAGFSQDLIVHGQDVISDKKLKNWNKHCKVMANNDNLIFTGFTNGEILITDTIGKDAPLRNIELNTDRTNSLCVSGNKVYFVGKDAKLHSFDFNDYLLLNGTNYYPLYAKVADEDGNVIAISSSGLYKISVNQSKFEWLGQVNDLSGVKLAVTGNGCIYVADDIHLYTISTTSHGFACARSANTIDNFHLELPFDCIESLYYDKDSEKLYVGSRHRLYTYAKNKTVRIKLGDKFSKDNPYFDKIFKYNQRLYAHSLNHGIFEIVGDSIHGSIDTIPLPCDNDTLYSNGKSVVVSKLSAVSIAGENQFLLTPNKLKWSIVLLWSLVIITLICSVIITLYGHYRQLKSKDEKIESLQEKHKKAQSLQNYLRDDEQIKTFIQADDLSLEACKKLKETIREFAYAGNENFERLYITLIKACYTVVRIKNEMVLSTERLLKEDNTEALKDVNTELVKLSNLKLLPEATDEEIVNLAVEICKSYEQLGKQLYKACGEFSEAKNLITRINTTYDKDKEIEKIAKKKLVDIKKDENKDIVNRIKKGQKPTTLQKVFLNEKGAKERTENFNLINDAINQPHNILLPIAELCANKNKTSLKENKNSAWASLILLFTFDKTQESNFNEWKKPITHYIYYYYWGDKPDAESIPIQDKSTKNSLYINNKNSKAISFLYDSLSKSYWDKQGIETLPHNLIDLLFEKSGLRKTWVSELLKGYKL